ncbi:unnamed protein product [Effrenium voratum]|uniref:EF-hand domain-containing protein n=2 Tax=Effrenium voratum TaxID=2562239 RepID=A0AA36HYS1_9DINO|nr:unnamed protein product [Effrenium voratum]CAJ1431138.1 unnamed protein product [Effrenium voratum]
MLEPPSAGAAEGRDSVVDVDLPRPSRAERLKTVFAPPTEDSSEKKRPNGALKELFSDFLEWVVHPYDVDVEEGDSDEETPQKQAEEEKEVVKKTMREKLQAVVASNGFEAASCLLIVVNMGFIGTQANCGQGSSCSATLLSLISTFDELFTALFLVEWCLRVAAFGRSYFQAMANWMDTFVVWIVGVFLLWVAPIIFGREGLAAFQAVRAIRAMRSLRSFRVLRRFQSFRMLLTGVLGTIFTLGACVLMLTITDLTFGILAVDVIGRDSEWGLAPAGTAAWYFQNGVIQASLTMSRFIFSDNAVDMIEELQEKQPQIWIFCFLFMAIAAYVILNLVTAVICDKAQAIVNENEAEKLFELRMQEKRNMKDLKRVFEVLDEDGSGQVTTEEFDAAFEIRECRDKFFLLGFEEEEMKQLFRVLDDDGQGELSVEEFLKGMAQVQGDCDSRSMLVATKSLEKVCLGFDKAFSRRGGKLSVLDADLTPQSDSELLTDIENIAVKRLDKIDEFIKNMSYKADLFEKQLATIESLRAAGKATEEEAQDEEEEGE